MAVKRYKTISATDNATRLGNSLLCKGSQRLSNRCWVEEYARRIGCYAKLRSQHSLRDILGKTATYGKDLCAVVYLALQFKFFYLSAKLHLEAILLQS